MGSAVAHLRRGRSSRACWRRANAARLSPDDTKYQACLRESTDEGRPWSDAAPVPQWRGVNEVALLVAANGDWVAACCTENPFWFDTHDIDHFCGLSVSTSKDQGKTWAELRGLYEWGRHHPSMLLLSDGRIVMSYVVRLGYPATPDGRTQFGIEAIISTDHGQTWDMEDRYVLATWTGVNRGRTFWYCSPQATSTAALPDGTLLTAFGTGFRNTPASERCNKDVALFRWRAD